MSSLPSRRRDDLVVANVTLIRARDVAARDANGFSDPYCKVKVASYGFTSSIIEKTLNPTWNETFVFKNVPTSATLVVTCWDKDAFHDDFLGQVEVPLALVWDQKAHTIEDWFRFHARKHSEKVSGHALIRIVLEARAHRRRSYFASASSDLGASSPTATSVSGSFSASVGSSAHGSPAGTPVSSASDFSARSFGQSDPSVPFPSMPAPVRPGSRFRASAPAKTTSSSLKEIAEEMDKEEEEEQRVVAAPAPVARSAMPEPEPRKVERPATLKPQASEDHVEDTPATPVRPLRPMIAESLSSLKQDVRVSTFPPAITATVCLLFVLLALFVYRLGSFDARLDHLQELFETMQEQRRNASAPELDGGVAVEVEGPAGGGAGWGLW